MGGERTKKYKWNSSLLASLLPIQQTSLIMRISTALVLLPAALATAFVIPKGTTDGVYATYTNEDGIEVHERLDNGVTGDSPIQTSKLDTRADKMWTTACGCGIGLNHGNTDAAVQDLKNQFGSGSRNQGSINYYSIRGDVVAFSCLQNAGFTVASANYLTRAFAKVTERCGWYIAGTAQLEPDAAQPSVAGYMRYTNGLDFCRNAFASPKTKC